MSHVLVTQARIANAGRKLQVTASEKARKSAQVAQLEREMSRLSERTKSIGGWFKIVAHGEKEEFKGDGASGPVYKLVTLEEIASVLSGNTIAGMGAKALNAYAQRRMNKLDSEAYWTGWTLEAIK